MPSHIPKKRKPKEQKKKQDKPVAKAVTRTAKTLQRQLARASRVMGKIAATPVVSRETITKRRRAKELAKRIEPERKALMELLTSKPKKKKDNLGKVEKVLGEFKEGTLRSSSGAKVTKRKQAIAIGLFEARRAGEKVAPAPKKRKRKK